MFQRRNQNVPLLRELTHDLATHPQTLAGAGSQGIGTLVALLRTGRYKKMTRRFLQRGVEFSPCVSRLRANDGTKALVSAGAACALGLAAFVAAFASFSASADPGDIVVLRSVEPHIAYRGIPQGTCR
ncbi:hypothetical protein ACU4GD_07120 [Cupriavidus basilensis]